jgi:phosphoserine phosphatase
VIYIFDICDTLYKSNTTFEFIDFYLVETHQKRKSVLLKQIRWKYSPVFLLLFLLGKITKTDCHKSAALQLLKGEKLENLENLATSFVLKELSLVSIRETHKILQDAKKSNATIFLVSSTIEPVAKAIAGQLEVNYLSSEIEVSQGLFIGKLKTDITGKKEKVLNKYIGQNEYTVVTDNFSDYNLVKSATQKHVVLYKPKHASYWKALNPNFIYPEKC